ncbi:MAG: c-type cytochrome [Planctomycetes bacterium]|nr:c-type cytochrome [Planctomycetota bacterium]
MHRVAIVIVTALVFAIAAIPLCGAPAEKSPAAPRIRKPVEPVDAVATIAAPKGFRVELVAAEPLVHDPMALEFDENGVAYVLEIPAYNEYGKPGPRTPGSVARLEDTDGDGRFDRRTTFAGDLKYPTGLFCYRGGLFVGDPPNLLYLRDTDGDGRADKREVLFTGFGAAQAGETQLNSFRWGLDNRIHICTGHDGGDIRPADQPDAPPCTVRSRRMLLDPRSRTFELTSGGGQHGMSFDDWGRTFVCDNSNPIQMIGYDDRYIERNPLMSAPSPVVSLGPGANFTKLARNSQPENWRLIRTQLLEQGVAVTDTYEFDRPSGVFTSATGVTIYRGDAWGDDLRGNAFTGEVVNNLVYHARLMTDGLNVVSERVGTESGFLASTDTWFRPVQFAHGPDGNLYVIDMYRELIEGIQWVPPEVVAKMDPTAGSDRGRIYRIAPQGFKQPPPVRMGRMPTKMIVKQLASLNGWHRDTAVRLLYERQDEQAIEPLRRMLTDAKFPQARMHALYALDGLDVLESDDVLCGFADSHPHVREHALRLAEQFAAESKAVRQAMADMIDDADVTVRLQLAFSLGSLPPAQRDPALIELLRRDGENAWFRVAIQSSLATVAADVVVRILSDDELRRAAHGQEFLATLANQVGRAKNEAEVRTVVAAVDNLDKADDANEALTKKIVVAILADGAGASIDEVAASSHGHVKEILANLLTNARTTALNQDEKPESRLDAIAILGCGSFAAEQPAFDELLAPQQPQPIQEAVVKILGRFSDAAVVELLLSKWPGLTPGLRSSAAEVLLSRPAWAESLLIAVENEEVPAGDFDPARIALLKSHPSPGVRERAVVVFAGSSVARRGDVVANYQESLTLTGSADQGRAVFQKTCAACHELEGKGTAIGADLKSIRDRGREAVMLNILDPNREINPKFLAYTVVTTEGRVITGMITEETPNHLTIRQADGTPVPIPRIDIDEMQSTGMSYMPEGLESQVDHQAMADLLAFLMSAGSTEQGAGSKE